MGKNSQDGPAGSCCPDASETGSFGPRALARRRAMMDAGNRLFLDKGFSNTSISDIVKSSGGSRATLYDLFGDKEGLLAAIMEESCDDFWKSLELLRASHASPAEFLFEFGCFFLNALADPESVAFTRMLVNEGQRFPAIATRFFINGPETLNRHLADYFRAAEAAHQLQFRDPDAAARAFVAMVQGDLILARLVGYADPLDGEAMRDYVRQVVTLFLHGCQWTEKQDGAGTEQPGDSQ